MMADGRWRLRSLLAADLRANVGRAGLFAGISAALYEPSFATLLLYRTASRLYGAGFRRVGKLLWRVCVAHSSCHIHLDAEIGPGLKLPHPTGITIGIGARLARDVTVYQNVTIGSGRRDKSYPQIGEGCVIFPGAVVVGGISIGPRAVIGANSVVIADVPADAIMAGNPARVIRIASGRDEVEPHELARPAEDA